MTVFRRLLRYFTIGIDSFHVRIVFKKPSEKFENDDSVIKIKMFFPARGMVLLLSISVSHFPPPSIDTSLYPLAPVMGWPPVHNYANKELKSCRTTILFMVELVKIVP